VRAALEHLADLRVEHREDEEVKWILASDVDGTLTGDRAALDRLADQLHQKRAVGELYLIISTGRRLEQVAQGIREEGLPEPDAAVCQVGTEIYQFPLGDQPAPLGAWRDRLSVRYSSEEARVFLEGIEGLVMQPEIYNTDLKTSCYLDHCPDPEEAAATIRGRVAPHADRYQVVWSSGRNLDIVPAASGKGRAIRFLLDHLGLDPERVVVAGDTGNDATMFEQFDRGVVVANAKPELLELARSPDDHSVYCARQEYAAGVEEGLEFHGVLDGASPVSVRFEEDDRCRRASEAEELVPSGFGSGWLGLGDADHFQIWR
jgi:sucrose-6F-phosphate phosphohydrolase